MKTKIQKIINSLEELVLKKILDSITNKTFYTIQDLYNPYKEILSLEKFMVYLNDNFEFKSNSELKQLTGVTHLRFSSVK